MAQTIILEPGNTAAISAPVEVAAGEFVIVGLFRENNDERESQVLFNVYQETPGVSNTIVSLTNSFRAVALCGPGTYRVSRPAYSGAPLGAFVDQ